MIVKRVNARVRDALRDRTCAIGACDMGNLLYWAIVALVIAVVAGLLGFGGIAGAATNIAQTLFYIFVVIFVIVLILNFVTGRGPRV